MRALREGISPKGSHYFPVFPYPSYTRMTEADMLDHEGVFVLARTRCAARFGSTMSRFPFPGGFYSLGGSCCSFATGSMCSTRAATPLGIEVRILSARLAHCGECHTPRNLLGAPDDDFLLAGTVNGPDGELVPNITPDPRTGIGGWSADDLVQLLKSGLKPDYDDVQGSMYEVIEHGLKFLTDEDLDAIAVYVLSQEPISNVVKRPK